MYVGAYAYVRVCVDHLHRCKTSFCLFCAFVVGSTRFSCHVCRGQWISFHPLPNEDGGLRLWYRDWSSRRTCNFPIYRQWQPAKPSTGMSFKTVSTSALLSQSGIILFWVPLHQNLLQSKDVESIPRTEFHDGSTNFSCQTFLDCLCTFDAFHISNSIRYFWASVCVWTICTDVKLPSVCFVLLLLVQHVFLAMYAGGQWISFHPLPNEDGGLRLWYRDWSSRRTCNFPIYRQWQPAKPSTGMSFKTVSTSALLSQSGILFYFEFRCIRTFFRART